MIEKARKTFNQSYHPKNHKKIIEAFQTEFPDQLQFKLSETPLFLTDPFKQKLLSVSKSIIEQIQKPEILNLDAKIPAHLKVPDFKGKPHFLAIDFGICLNQNNEIEPQLIELQAFPSLFFYQLHLIDIFKKVYPNLKPFRYLLDAPNNEAYVKNLQELIVGNEKVENVILLEIFPETQKTKIDFTLCEQMLGIKTVCFTKLIKKGNQLFYESEGRQIRIKRIFNRFIFDDLAKYPDLKTDYKITDSVDVEWVTHPQWFYKISKILLPHLKHTYIPQAYAVSDFPKSKYAQLNNYVLKPLFSYAGQGVILNPTPKDLTDLKQPEDYILQQKVAYAPIFKDPNGHAAKAEIRLLYTWHDHEPMAKPQISLVRMTKSEMINVDHNKAAKIWTGSSFALFE